MDWTKGYTASYYGMYIDPLSWQNVERFEITGGSISKKCDGLRVSASVDCVDYDTSVERWVRVYMNSRQGDEAESTPMFTGIATSPNNNYNGDLKTNTLQCYSPLKVAEDMLLQRGWFAPEDGNGAELVRELLSEVPAPVEIIGASPLLQNNIIAEDNETHLSMIDKILTAINWRICVRGDGTIEIKALTRTPQAEISPTTNDIIEPQIEVNEDWFGCPNVYRCYNDNESVEVVDETSEKISVNARGRQVQKQETSVNLNADETLAEYAKRRLKEEQYVEMTGKYSRRYLPDLIASDVVRLRYPNQGLIGDFLIYSQSIELAYGAKVSEEVVKI